MKKVLLFIFLAAVFSTSVKVNAGGFSQPSGNVTYATGVLPIANGGTNNNGTSYLPPSGFFRCISFFDGVMLKCDANMTHLSFNTNTNTFNTGAIHTTIAGSNIVGDASGGAAAAGDVGEYVEVNSCVSPGSTNLTSNVNANVVTLPLSAGDWDVTGLAVMQSSAAAVTTYYAIGSSLVSATFPPLGSYTSWSLPAGQTGLNEMFAIPSERVSLAAPANVYMVALATFTGGTVGACGVLSARRRR